MQIVQLSGGLGNQLFQYAFYLILKKAGHVCYIDDVTCYNEARDRNVQLGYVGANYDKAETEDILRLTDHKRNLINWLRRRITGSRDVIRHEGDEVTADGYWIGYWQSADGFDEIADDIRANVFGSGFRDEVINSPLAKEICDAESVSIHIRRGDYLNPDVQAVYGGICTDEYYEAAIKHMLGKHPDCRFFVFSNDTDWVKQNLTIDNMVVVEGSDENHGYRDMYLMSLCKHNILANSSFSWWAAWLNNNPEKIILGPSVWIHRKGFDRIYNNFPVKKISPEGRLL